MPSGRGWAVCLLCGVLVVGFVASTARSADIRIDSSRTYQIMDGVGACACSFPYASADGWDWNAVKFVFDELDLRYIRLFSWLSNWEPRNDNADPNTINWSGFARSSSSISGHDVPFAKYLTGRKIEVMLGVWNLSDWLAGGTPRHVEPAQYPELGETIAAYLLNMKNNGVPQTLVEVQNEPAIEASIRYPNPAAFRDAGRAVVSALDHFGLGQVQLHAPNFHTPPETVAWGQIWMQDPVLAGRTAAISYHTWWSSSFNDYDVIRQFAESCGRPVWATEVGYCALVDGCFGNTHFLRPQTWGTAWDYAMSHYRAIAWSNATRIYHWTILGYDAAVGRKGERYPSFYALKHFANYIPPGATRIAATSYDNALLCVAFLLPDGNYSVIVLNTSSASRPVALIGLPRETLEPLRSATTRETLYDGPVQDLGPGPNGSLKFTAPGQSITSLRVGPYLPVTDLDGDNDVDIGDVDVMRGCMGSPGAAPTAECAKADLDRDRDVDQSDFGILQRCLTGQGIRADANCGR